MEAQMLEILNAVQDGTKSSTQAQSELGKIETHMIPSGKYFVRDNNKRELDLKDSFEDALKSMLD